jgi:hypothetical protein
MTVGYMTLRFYNDTFQKWLRITTETSLGNIGCIGRDLDNIERSTVVWTGRIWFRIGGKCGLFWVRRWTSGFLGIRGISWVGERLSGAGEETYFSLWTAWFTFSWNCFIKIENFSNDSQRKNGLWLLGILW